jgi:hypothetical protein
VEIAAFAARTGADLVVMASRGLSGIERLVFGSTAEAVLRTVAAPVMVVHPRSLSTRNRREEIPQCRTARELSSPSSSFSR